MSQFTYCYAESLCAECRYAECLGASVLAIPFRPSLIFAGKDGSQPLEWSPLVTQSTVSTTNIRLECLSLSVTFTLV